jgi:hypothetical protein
VADAGLIAASGRKKPFLAIFFSASALTAYCLLLTAYYLLAYGRAPNLSGHTAPSRRPPGRLWHPPETFSLPKVARGGISTPIFRLRFGQGPALLAEGLSSVSDGFRNRGRRDISGGRSGRDPHARFLRRVRSGETASIAICSAPSSFLNPSTPGMGLLLESEYSSGPRNPGKSGLIHVPFSNARQPGTAGCSRPMSYGAGRATADGTSQSGFGA